MSSTGTVTWIGVPSIASLSGDWGAPGDWSTGSVPASTDTVAIGPGITAIATGWTVTATNEAAGALTLGLGLLGTFTPSGSLTIGGAVTFDTGTLIAAAGTTLTFATLLQQGGVASLTGATLSAGGVTDDGTDSLAGGSLGVTGALAVGFDGNVAQPTLVPGTGTLALTGGATASAGTLDLLNQSTLSVDSLSAMMVGTTAAVAGAVVVAAGSTLAAVSGVLDANLVLDGVLDTSAPLIGQPDPTSLDIAGTLSGTGSILLSGGPGAAGVLEIASAAGFAGSISLDPGTELILDAGGLPATTLHFAAGTIDLRGQAWGSGLTPLYDATTGMLTLGTSTLDVGLGLDPGAFVATADASGGTELRIDHNVVWQADTAGNASGAWTDPTHWSNGAIPDAATFVTIGPGITVSSAWTVAATNEAAQSLTLEMATGTLALAGSLALVGALAMQSGVLLADAATLTEGGQAVLDGSAVVTLGDGGTWLAPALWIGASGSASVVLAAGPTLGTGGNLAVAGALLLGQALYQNGTSSIGTGLLSVADGSEVSAASLGLAGSATLAVDSLSAVVIGSAASVAGAVAVGTAATLTALGMATLQSALVDNGVVVAQAATSSTGATVAGGALLTGPFSGSGTLLLAGSLELAGSASFDGSVSLAAGSVLQLDQASTLAGTLSGSGAVLDDAGLTLTAAADGFTGSIDLAANQGLTLEAGATVPVALINLGKTGSIDLSGEPYAAGALPTYDPTNGLLTLDVTTVDVGLGYTVAQFAASPDGTGGTLLTFNPVATWVASNGTLDGDWSAGPHWDAASVPGAGANIAVGPYITSAVPWTVTLLHTQNANNVALSLGSTGTVDMTGTLDANGTIAANSGTLLVGSGGNARAAAMTLAAGAAVSVGTGGMLALGHYGASAPAGGFGIDATGSLAIAAGSTLAASMVAVNAGGTLALAAGSLDLASTLTGGGLVTVGGNASPGTLEVAALNNFSGTLAVTGGLVIDSGTLGSAQVQLALASALDLRGVAFDGQTLSYDPTTGVASVGGITLDTISGLTAASGLPPAQRFAVTSDGAGGLLIETPCFAAGTRIRGPEGERPVELLRPGDRVLTVTGRLAPVRWVGWVSIDLARHPAPQHAAPVRILADAIAPGVPQRDLCVSPDHALWLDGRLVPARLLCNGATIFSEQTRATISYVHVELDRHDILLAEGMAAESYLDTGNRALFAGEAGVRALYPDLAAAAAARRAYARHGAAPLTRRADALHARLKRRAAALGWQLTTQADLRITTDMPGTAATAFGADGLHLFLPPGGREVRFNSRSFIPDQFDPGAGDGRRLGVALGVRRNHKPLAARAYAEGWHAPLPGCRWRWTDGAARIVLAPSPCEVKLTIKLMAASGRYWLAPEAAEAAARNSAA